MATKVYEHVSYQCDGEGCQRQATVTVTPAGSTDMDEHEYYCVSCLDRLFYRVDDNFTTVYIPKLDK